ncbi:MAG: transposase [bacterium]|nr:transposase [bacterium]
MMPYDNLRQGRFSQQYNDYFVTICCYERNNLLIDADINSIVINSIHWLDENNLIDLYFYILMPDHVHIIFQLTGAKTLGETVKSFKQYTSRIVNKNRDIQLWQKSFYDHCIRKEESLAEKIKYCWYNPVRANLVQEPAQYHLWWCKFDLPIL